MLSTIDPVYESGRKTALSYYQADIADGCACLYPLCRAVGVSLVDMGYDLQGKEILWTREVISPRPERYFYCSASAGGGTLR